MTVMTRRLFLLVFVALSSFAAAADKPAAKTVRLLTVGNSFSRNATNYLDELAEAAGHTLIHHACSIGGGSMQQHVEKFTFHEADPADPRGLYTTKKSLKQELLAEPWDYITIQQASIKSHNVDTFHPFAHQLRDYIRRHAPKAELLVHQTWAYRVDDPRFTPNPSRPRAEGEPATQREMYAGLTAAYKAIAAELGARRIPVGDAFYIADTDAKWGFKPDPAFDARAAAKKPGTLPPQPHSLHVGWRWRKQSDGRETLGFDGHHANLAGEYLGACVWFEVLFGQSVVDNTFVPPGLDPKYAKFLRQTAHEAVKRNR